MRNMFNNIAKGVLGFVIIYFLYTLKSITYSLLSMILDIIHLISKTLLRIIMDILPFIILIYLLFSIVNFIYIKINDIGIVELIIQFTKDPSAIIYEFYNIHIIDNSIYFFQFIQSYMYIIFENSFSWGLQITQHIYIEYIYNAIINILNDLYMKMYNILDKIFNSNI